MEQCFFKDYYKCSEKDGELKSNKDSSRITSITAACVKRGETELYEHLQSLTAPTSTPKILYHTKCFSKFCSVKSQRKSSADTKDAKRRRSDTPAFDFKLHCLYCGEVCDVDPSKKHPDRWRESYIFTTCEYYSSKTNKTVEWYKPLETLCHERIDKMSRDILMRLSGMRSDLPS